MLFYWLCDLFYMAFILDSLALKFIFGGLIMTIIFMNLSKAFIGGNPQLKWGLVQDFIVGVGMSVYLIYIIPDADLQNVVIPIVSAVYGGLITLVGVAWTIRKADKDRKIDEMKAIHPIIYPFGKYNDINTKNLITIQFKSKEEQQPTCIYLGTIKNTDNAILLIKEIVVDGERFSISYGDVLDKGKFADLEILTNKKLRFDDVILIGTDVKDNIIKYRLFLNLSEKRKDIKRIIEVD